MKYKTSLIARNLLALSESTGNIYEAVAIISRRARQIAVRTQEELDSKLAEFVPEDIPEDTVEQVINEDDIEKRAAINRFYESMPKPTIIATEEFLAKELTYRYVEPIVTMATT